MKRIIAFTAASIGLSIFLVGGNAVAQNFVVETGTSISGSTEFGFNPERLINAIDGTGDATRCFTCKNPNAGGTTAGALTNSMFGKIRPNAEADLGDKSFHAQNQGMLIPQAASCGTNCNDSSAFTFSLPLPTQNFLSTGDLVATTNPSTPETVGNKGVKMEFSNTFNFLGDVDGDGVNDGSTFEQSMSQTTFTEGMGGNEIQIVSFEASGSSPESVSASTATASVNWLQSIEEGGFNLGLSSGNFDYDPTSGSLPSASTPTGSGQSTGADGQQIP